MEAMTPTAIPWPRLQQWHPSPFPRRVLVNEVAPQVIHGDDISFGRRMALFAVAPHMTCPRPLLKTTVHGHPTDAAGAPQLLLICA